MIKYVIGTIVTLITLPFAPVGAICLALGWKPKDVGGWPVEFGSMGSFRSGHRAIVRSILKCFDKIVKF